MTKDQFLAEWINDNPTKESIPRFSVKEALKLIQDWEDYIDKHLKPTKQEILEESNKQKDYTTRLAFSKGAQWMHLTKYRKKDRKKDRNNG